jgi:hypothetical protein
MQCTDLIVRHAFLLSSLLVLLAVHPVDAAEKPTATLWAKDSLTSPNQPVAVEVKLTKSGPRGGVGIAGERLELVQDGKVVETAVTGEDGRAVFRHHAKTRGNTTLTVRTAETAHVVATAMTTMAAWERRMPILTVELSALFKEPALQEPIADAVEELGKLTQYYYNLIYVVTEGLEHDDAFQASDLARQWLAKHKFPLGYVLVLPPGEGMLGHKIDELRAGGWTTLKMGVGRTKPFAEAFLQRRLDAVMVPEPTKAETPRKAKVAKEWKEIRKKL